METPRVCALVTHDGQDLAAREVLQQGVAQKDTLRSRERTRHQGVDSPPPRVPNPHTWRSLALGEALLGECTVQLSVRERFACKDMSYEKGQPDENRDQRQRRRLRGIRKTDEPSAKFRH